MNIYIPKVKIEKKEVSLNIFSWIGSYIFATYDKDKRKFKIRNRIILANALGCIFYSSLYYFSSEIQNETNLNQVAQKTELNLNKDKWTIAKNENVKVADELYLSNDSYDKYKVSPEEIKEVLNELKEEDTEIVENENTVDEIIKETKEEKIILETKESTTEPVDSYVDNSKLFYIQIAAVYKLDYLKKELNRLDELGYEYTMREYRTKKGSLLKKVLVGPFQGYDKAKEKLSFINKELKVNGFVRNFEK